MILNDIVADKRARLVEHKKRISVEEMKKMALDSKRNSISFYNALAKDGLSIIGEFKKASPSMGIIDGVIDLTERIDQYNASVDAISVLTEEDHFNGSVEYLKQVRGISNLPIIRKDFIIDEYQVYEAKVIGADCILLIASILGDKDMEALYKLAYSLGMDVLLEVHDEIEMERALRLGAKIVGVNNRNLKDFTIDLNNSKRLSAFMDERMKELGCTNRPLFVSESGVTEDSHIEILKQCNVNALLIGRAFMESKEPEAVAKKWKGIFNES
ncbi:MAG: indole-3-glycerol phosphate synthase TrpC [Clostridiales bacterium]|nr:indole-3-glycerol phosphate synthase TrpC [Clostridiales bacterium]